MAKILEVPELVDQHRVPEMQIRSRWIKAGLDPQRPAALQLVNQFRLDQQFFRPALDQLQVFFTSAHANLYRFCPDGFWLGALIIIPAKAGCCAW